MVTNYVLEDKELGVLKVRVYARARRLTFTTKEDGIHVTVPPGTSVREVENAVNQLRLRLRQARQKRQQRRSLIDLDFRIDADYFKLRLVSGQREKFLSRSELGEMQIVCPPDADFSNADLQAWLHKVIEEALRRNAKIILPPRLYQLAMQHGLSYKSCKINSSSGRWGSCSARGSINLSYYLMLLPRHLIDYVLLHELAHTREMNHGERFWALLNKMTDGKALQLREELKRYRTEF
ncbi:MAG: SprT family zinc-dependent metalloprotease [Bacteroides sp.]|nr:SprT family zinc-dependent metalloprotease [Bacteroides sp.]